MSRPSKNTVEYFPHECAHGRKMHIMETRYGNDGYAVWFKLLEQLGLADNHYLDLRDNTQMMYLESIFKVDSDKAKKILDDLANMGAIHKNLWEDFKIIFSEKFIDGVEEAYKRRNSNCITLEGLCIQLLIKCKQKPCYCGVCVDINPQSKVKESKEDKSKVNDIPTFEDFKTYALENDNNIDLKLLEQKYESWKVNGWKTGGDKPREIKNWKTTLLNTLPFLQKKGGERPKRF